MLAPAAQAEKTFQSKALRVLVAEFLLNVPLVSSINIEVRSLCRALFGYAVDR